MRTCRDVLFGEATPCGACEQCRVSALEAQLAASEAARARLREALERAHDCATFSPRGGTCHGCYVSEALAADASTGQRGDAGGEGTRECGAIGERWVCDKPAGHDRMHSYVKRPATSEPKTGGALLRAARKGRK